MAKKDIIGSLAMKLFDHAESFFLLDGGCYIYGFHVFSVMYFCFARLMLSLAVVVCFVFLIPVRGLVKLAW